MAAKKKAAKKKVIKRKKAAPKKKPVIRKPKPKAKAKPKSAVKQKGTVIGTVTHYFPHVRAAVIKLKSPLLISDTIKIKGHTTDFKQSVTSMQIDRVPIETAKKGDEIGLLVESRVRQHDLVYKEGGKK